MTNAKKVKRLQLYLFGSLRVVNGDAAEVLTGNVAALLGYLGLHDYALPRTQIAGALFPDVAEAQARRLLTHTLYRLRREIDLAYVQADSETIGLRNVWVDVAEFEQLVQLGELSTAIDLYKADLLELVDAEWVLGLRTKLRQRLIQLLEKQIEAYAAGEAYAAALGLAQRWTREDPFDEAAHVWVMQLYVKQENYAAALRQYDFLVELFDVELAVEPMPATQLFAQQLQDSLASVSAEFTHLIGRRRERAQILSRLENQRGAIVLLEGEAGIGKTHLLDDVCDALRWRKIAFERAKVDQVVQLHPYAPLDAVLQTALADKPTLLANMTPLASRMIDSLLPTTTAATAVPATSASPRALNLALRQLLALLTAEQPLVLLFDDVQWASDAFWNLLPTLSTFAATRPLALVLSFRSREMRENAAGWLALTALDEAHAPLRVELGGFSEEESAEFARRLGYDFTSTQLSELQRQSRGNPYLLRELLKGSGADTIDQLLSLRLAELSQDEREALDAASVVGGLISAETWQMMLGNAPPINALLSKQLIVQTDGFQFEHDLLRIHVLNMLSQHDRQIWHQRAAQALAGSVPPATLAWHQAEAGDGLAAIESYREAADVALLLHDYTTATATANRASAIATEAGSRGALSQRVLQLQVIEANRVSSENLDEMVALADLATALDERTQLLRVRRLQFQALAARGAIEAVNEMAGKTLAVATELGDREAEITIHLAVASHKITLEADIGAATEWIDHALTLAEQPNSPPHLLVEALLAKLVARARLPSRDLDELNRYHERAVALLAQHPYLRSLEPSVRRHGAIVAQLSGNLEKAWHINCDLVELYQQEGADGPLRDVRFGAAHLAKLLGQHAEAILYAEELVQAEIERVGEQDSYFVNYYRTYLVEAYTLAGELDAGAEEAQHLLRWLQNEPNGNAARQAWSSIGLLYFYRDELDAAWHAHSRAMALVAPEMQTTASPFLNMAEVAHQLGKQDEARELLKKAAELLSKRGTGSNRILYFYLDYLMAGKIESLSACRDELALTIRRMTTPRIRHDYIHQLKFHRGIAEAWRNELPDVRLIALPAVENSAEKRTIYWTIDAGPLDADYETQHGRVALRHHRLRRLLDEADLQGTAPSRADLAAVLGVTQRTVHRDLASIAQA